MAPEVGMDVDAVRGIASRLDAEAARLANVISATDASVSTVAQAWIGHDAQEFVGWWQHQHRPALLQAHEAIAGLARSARNNATAQQQVSDDGGGAGSATGTRSAHAGGAPGFGTALRQVDSAAGPLGSVLSTLGAAKGLAGATAMGGALGAFGYFTDGYSIGEDFGRGHYVDGALDTTFTGLDVTSDALKAGGPLGYGEGVALKSWVDVGRAAQDVDWSRQGMQQLQDASLGDWASAFGDAVKQMPLKLVGIFSF